MWVIKNKKYGNYYHCTINKNMKHFVTYILEAKEMTKWEAKKIMQSLGKPELYELQEVKN